MRAVNLAALAFAVPCLLVLSLVHFSAPRNARSQKWARFAATWNSRKLAYDAHCPVLSSRPRPYKCNRPMRESIFNAQLEIVPTLIETLTRRKANLIFLGDSTSLGQLSVFGLPANQGVDLTKLPADPTSSASSRRGSTSETRLGKPM